MPDFPIVALDPVCLTSTDPHSTSDVTDQPAPRSCDTPFVHLKTTDPPPGGPSPCDEDERSRVASGRAQPPGAHPAGRPAAARPPASPADRATADLY
eukprot:4081664-Prymnesium_polylepis.1